LGAVVLLVVFGGGVSGWGGKVNAGDGNSGTTPGTYTVTVTGTSGSIASTGTVSVTVE